MKFGRQLETLAHPRYQGHYLDYNGVKRALKVWTGIDREQSTVQEVTHWASSFLRLGSNPKVSPEMRLYAMLRHEMEQINKFVAAEEAGLRASLSQLVLDAAGGFDGCHPDGEELLGRLADLAEHVVQLKAFVDLNFTGFRKILKKYDKWSGLPGVVTPWFMAEVTRACFMKVNFDDAIALLATAASAGRATAVGGEVRPSQAIAAPRAAPRHYADLREAVYVADHGGTMRIRTMLAMQFEQVCGPRTSVHETGAERERWTSVFFDTPGFRLYRQAVSPEQPGDSGCVAGDLGAPKRARFHLCRAAGDSEDAMLVRVEGAERAESRMGCVAAEALASGSPCRDVLAKVGTGAVGDEDARWSLGQMAEAGAVAVAQASFCRSRFCDLEHGVMVTLDEEVRFAAVDSVSSHVKKDGGASAAVVADPASQVLPKSIITVCCAGGEGLGSCAAWLQAAQERADLVRVAGFSKAALGIACLHGAGGQLPQPGWYQAVAAGMAADEEGPDKAGRRSAISPIAEGRASGAVCPAPVAPAEQPGLSAVGRRSTPPSLAHASGRLLHDYGTAGAPAKARHQAAQSRSSPGAAAFDAWQAAGRPGGLQAPLLDRGSPAGDCAARPASRVGALAGLLSVVRGGQPPTSDVQQSLPMRGAIVAVQPKTLFSNERTFLEWMHMATLLASAGVASMHRLLPCAGPQVVGRLMVLAAALLAAWALRTFHRRADALDRKAAVDYHDPFGPPAVIIVMLAGLIACTAHALLAMQLAAADVQ